MEKNFLQLFLETGLFDVGDNDTRLANLESSIADVQAKLTKEIKLIPVYTLVALDPKVPEGEQVLVDTETIVTEHWRALRTKYADRPIPILRGVILNALYNIGVSSPKIARIICLTATNFYPYAELNKESGIVHKLLVELSSLAEKNAMEEWALEETESSVKVPTLKITGLKFGEIKIDKATLEAGLLKAASNDPATSHGPQNGQQYWSPHFAKTASETITKVLGDNLSKFGDSLSPETLEVPINKFFTDFKKSLDDALKSSFNSIQAVEQRSKLLWWKETLYSTALKCGYRELDPALQPIMMAYDLYILLPNITPVSVDYLLKDTLRLVNLTLDTEITLKEMLTGVNSGQSKETLKQYFGDKPGLTGKVTITDFLRLLIHDRLKVEDLPARTGLSLTQKASASYFTVAILHDLMVEHLVK